MCQIFFFNFLAPFILSHNTNMKDLKKLMETWLNPRASPWGSTDGILVPTYILRTKFIDLDNRNTSVDIVFICFISGFFRFFEYKYTCCMFEVSCTTKSQSIFWYPVISFISASHDTSYRLLIYLFGYDHMEHLEKKILDFDFHHFH